MNDSHPTPSGNDASDDVARYLRPVETKSRDIVVLERLAALIGGTAMQPGDRLPAERELAERLGVGRSTVREALSRWAALGVVERRKGSGTFLLTKVDPDTRHVPVAVQFEREALRRMVEVRRALELEVVGLACERATDAELEIIAERFRALDAAHARYGASHDHDRAFHQAIYDGAHNVVFSHLIGQLQVAFDTAYDTPFRDKDYGDASFPLHRVLADAIAARDAEAARVAIGRILDILLEELDAIGAP